MIMVKNVKDKDRQGRNVVWTNKRTNLNIFRTSIKSYKSCPKFFIIFNGNLGQIRPRFGVMRCREFYMKDAYSFDLSDEEAEKSYNKMFYSYINTFNRLGLKAIPMSADTGPIGGDLSHEFVILAETGESQIYADKRIFEIDVKNYDFTNNSLKKMRSDFHQYMPLQMKNIMRKIF